MVRQNALFAHFSVFLFATVDCSHFGTRLSRMCHIQSIFFRLRERSHRVAVHESYVRQPGMCRVPSVLRRTPRRSVAGQPAPRAVRGQAAPRRPPTSRRRVHQRPSSAASAPSQPAENPTSAELSSRSPAPRLVARQRRAAARGWRVAIARFGSLPLHARRRSGRLLPPAGKPGPLQGARDRISRLRQARPLGSWFQNAF